MKTVFLQTLFAVGVVLAVLAGCDTDEPDQWVPKEGEIQVTAETGVQYFSLSTGEKITDPAAIASKAWDIGFQRTRTILTNSGYTAEELHSGGQGGVWYTEKTVFAEVVQSDAVTNSDTAYNTDILKYVNSMSTTSPVTLNVMNFPGYGEGDGTQSTPFKTLKYNQKQFYIRESSSNYPVTNVIYVIRHGDGSHHSKIQITDYEYNGSAPSDTFVIQYENLN